MRKTSRMADCNSRAGYGVESLMKFTSVRDVEGSALREAFYLPVANGRKPRWRKMWQAIFLPVSAYMVNILYLLILVNLLW